MVEMHLRVDKRWNDNDDTHPDSRLIKLRGWRIIPSRGRREKLSMLELVLIDCREI